MDKSIKFSVDKRSVVEGDYVDVSWECTEPEMVVLVVEDGSNRATYQLADSGTKRLFLQGPKQAIITLKASLGSRVLTERAEITIKPRPKTKSSSARPKRERAHTARPVGNGWWSRQKYRLRSYWASLRYTWSCMPERKRLAYTIMWLLMAVMMLYYISPSLLFVGLLGVVGYLMWIVFKR